MELETTLDVEVLSDEPFKKQFSYEIPSNNSWNLVETSSLAQSDDTVSEKDSLLKLKNSLNAVKSSLNDFDIVQWSSHTNFTNPSAKILPFLRKSFHPELATQAWCKFYELLSYGNLIPDICEKSLCTVHLCEAPGGFICALNHFLKSFYPKDISHLWVANTLNPYYEGNTLDSCIVDDRLISRTLRSWCFGNDNTGNILHSNFISSLLQQCSQTFHDAKVNLITADGSLNCQDDPSEQETIVAPLHYTELLCALSILSIGGNFVIKMFTLFEEHSVSFIYALCCLFDTVSILKPATSKAGNSEVYVVSRGFCGQDQCKKFIHALKKHFPFQSFIKDGKVLVPNIPKSFLKQHISCVKLFTDFQINTIKSNIKLYRNMTDKLKDSIKELQEVVTQKFFDTCDVKKVHAKQCIVSSGILRSNVKSNLKLRPRLEGSFTQRKLNDGEETESISHVETKPHTDPWLIVPKWFVRESKAFWWNTTQAVVGKDFSSIHSSLFCATDIIVQYEQAFELLLQKGYYAVDCVSDVYISNDLLMEELSCNISCINGSVLEVKLEKIDEFHTNWIQTLIKNSNANLKCLRTNLSQHMKNHHKLAEHSEFIFANLVFSCFNSSKWSELQIRFKLIYLILLVVKTLKKGGLCLFVLPSLLTRLSAQIMWIFSQCFEETLILPVKSSDALAHPAILFVGKKFNMVHSYISSLIQVSSIMSSSNPDVIMELFPITALLHTEKAAPFIEAVKTANEKCLLESICIINRKLSSM